MWKIPVSQDEGAVFCEAVTRNEKVLTPGCVVLLQKDPLGESSDSCVGKLSGSKEETPVSSVKMLVTSLSLSSLKGDIIPYWTSSLSVWIRIVIRKSDLFFYSISFIS